MMPIAVKLNNNFTAILTALAAAIIYGGWAVYANFEHGTNAWLMAGAVQAGYAFFSTFTITHVARWTFIKYGGGIKGITVGFVLSFIVMLMIPLVVHTMAGTPDILQTILPGLIWGSVYLMSFLLSLNLKNK